MALNGTEDVNVGFGANLTGLTAGLSQAVSKIRESTDQMKTHLGSVSAAAEKLGSAFLKISAIAAGAGMFKHAIDESVQLAKEVGALSRQFDITAGAASGMRLALEEAGLKTEDLQHIQSTLNRQLKLNEPAMNAMGIVTRDANHHYVDQKTLLDNAIEAMRKFKAGTDQNLAATVAFGRGMDQQTLQQLMRFSTLSEDAEEKARSFGLVLGADAVQAAKEFSIAQKDMKGVLEGVMVTIGSALTPAFTNLMKMFTNGASAEIPIVKLAFDSLGKVLLGLTFVVQTVWTYFKTFIQSLVTAALALADIWSDLQNGKWAKIGEDARNASAAIKDSWLEAFEAIGKDAEKTGDQINKLGDTSSEGSKVKKPGGTSGDQDYDKFEKDKSSKLLELIKKRYAELLVSQGDYATLSKDAEVAYWAQYLNTFAKGTKEAIEINTAYHKARRDRAAEGVDIERAQLDIQIINARTNEEEKLKIADKWLAEMSILYGNDSKQYRAALNSKVQAEQAYVNQMRQFEDQRAQLGLDVAQFDRDLQDAIIAYQVETGEISKTQAAKVKMQSIQEQYDLLLADNARKRALYADDLAQQQLLATEEVKLQAEKNKALQVQAIEVQRVTRQSYLDVFGSVVDTVGSSLDQILAKTLSWRGLMQNVVQSLQSSFIKLGVERVKDWIFSESTMTAASRAFAAIRNALGWTSAAQATAAKTAEADVVITESAGEAAAGAAASQASIPFIGPILAVAAAAAILALVLGFKGGGGGGSAPPTPSAAGGWWEIPQDTLAMVHKKEMVMPANLAEPLRDAIESGTLGGGGGNHYHISAIDSQSVAQFFDQHGDVAFNSIKGKLRNNSR